jgi:type IV secretory pathway VirB10-like protein
MYIRAHNCLHLSGRKSREDVMKPIRFALSIALCATLAFSFAQLSAQEPNPPNGEPNKHHEASPRERKPDASPRKQEEEKPPKHEPEAKPPKREPEAKPQKTERQEVPQPSKDEKKAAQKQQKEKEKATQKEQKEQKKTAHEQHGASAEQAKARPAGKSAHIPDPQFKAHFGKPHKFAVRRVVTTTTIVPNQTRFVYSGYTFIFIDPWPTEWLFTDDCYIDYVDDEYFLFDVFHPGIRVALFVVG